LAILGLLIFAAIFNNNAQFCVGNYAIPPMSWRLNNTRVNLQHKIRLERSRIDDSKVLLFEVRGENNEGFLPVWG